MACRRSGVRPPSAPFYFAKYFVTRCIFKTQEAGSFVFGFVECSTKLKHAASEASGIFERSRAESQNSNKKTLKHYRSILIIGIIEILIGGVTLFVTLLSLIFGSNTKSPNVLLFVVVSATVSSSLGFGILKFRKTAYDLLIYFSSVILLSKILIALDIIQLHGALETAIPNPLKTFISIVYHSVIILYLRQESVRKIFHD